MGLDATTEITEWCRRLGCDAAPDCDATPAPFVTTKEHRRFAEFCDAVRRHRYIGLCYGPPGVGKTHSARRYAAWDVVNHWLGHMRTWHDQPDTPAALLDRRTAFYTPSVTTSPCSLEAHIRGLTRRISDAVETHLHPDRAMLSTRQFTELLILDEADRLKTVGMEIVRDHHDRHGIGVVLIGMPGLEKRLARYPQLYSRIGFVHHYRPLSADEQAFVLNHHWPQLGLGDPGDFTAAEALAAITRITAGNFRLTTRLVAQIERILEINQMGTVTKEVVEAARESLVIGIP